RRHEPGEQVRVAGFPELPDGIFERVGVEVAEQQYPVRVFGPQVLLEKPEQLPCLGGPAAVPAAAAVIRIRNVTACPGFEVRHHCREFLTAGGLPETL